MSEPVLTGSLQKRSTFRQWTARHVSVAPGVLQYQSRKGLLRKADVLESVSLANSIVGEAPEMKRAASSKHSDFVFKLAVEGADKIHHFAAASREEMVAWISAIGQCGAKIETPGVERMISSSATSCPFTRIWVNTDDSMLCEAERLVFADCSTRMRQQMVAAGAALEMNTWISVDGEGKPPLVLMHGWGASCAFWYRTVDLLSEHFQLYIADWLGFGRSTSAAYEGRFCQEAEDYWLQPFERWTVALGLDSFFLAGHSLGGYLCCKYAAAHPRKVRALVLVSPGGTTVDCATVFHAEKHRSSAGSDRSGADDDAAGDGHEDGVADDAAEHIGAHSDSEDGQEREEPPQSAAAPPVAGSVAPPPRPRIAALTNPRVQNYVWNLSPSGLLRKLGPYGRKVATRALRQRWGDHASPAFVQYTYHMFVRQGGHPGENATRHVFKPIALPYHPLEECAASLQMPSLWLFGDRDWMAFEGGLRCKALLPKELQAASHVCVIRGSTHQIMLDAPADLSAIMIDWIVSGGISVGATQLAPCSRTYDS